MKKKTLSRIVVFSLLLITSLSASAQIVVKKFEIKRQWLMGDPNVKGVVMKFKNTSDKTIKKIFIDYVGVDPVSDAVYGWKGKMNQRVECTGPYKPHKTESGYVTDLFYTSTELKAFPHQLGIVYMDNTYDIIPITKTNLKSFFPKIKWMDVNYKNEVFDNSISYINNLISGNEPIEEISNNGIEQPKEENSVLQALGAGLLAASSAALSNTGYSGGYSSPQRTPMPTYNGNGSAYVAQIQARTNQQMADLNNRVQQIKQDGITQFQDYSNRSLNATMELADWCAQFKNQNGREPYESEKDQWMQQHYPDVYPYYIQGKYGGGNSDSNAETENSGQKAKSTQSNSTRDCVYCNGSGRVVIEKPSLSFGIGEKRKKCQECGAWIMSDEAHVHVDCNHCKGTGKVTY